MPTTREDIAPGDTLQSYVPELVRRRARDVPIPERGGYRYEAAVLFADMSGFTALTEMLASRQDGAEEISRVLNAYFGRISDLVSAHGGDLLRLAGDAAVATWGRTEGRVAMHDLIASAAACALAIRDAVHGLELHGARISVRSAISCGEVLESHVGGVDGHWEFLVAGDPLVDVTEGLRRAQPGEVLVAPGSWRFIHERSEGIADRDGFVRLASAPAVELPRVGIDDAADASLRAYIPDAVLSRYDAGQTAWLAELRQVTVVFVRLSGIDYGRTDALDRIDDVLRALQTPLYRAEGAVRQFLVDDKGTVLIAAFGLPPSSHEDDAVRAVRTAIAMREAAAKRGVDTSVGITTGRVFCGPIGSGRRREYALVGDVVNVAARLMEAAPDDVLCDAETHQRARHRIAFERLPTFELKGKGTASALFRPSFGPGPGGAQQMVGRESEHGMILEAVERLRAGKGGVVLIEGEPGVGKTRLLAEALRSIGAVDVLRGHADPLERSRPYHAWVPVFDVILGVGTGDDAAIRTLLSDTELGRHAALLNSIAKVDLPETDLTREYDGAGPRGQYEGSSRSAPPAARSGRPADHRDGGCALGRLGLVGAARCGRGRRPNDPRARHRSSHAGPATTARGSCRTRRAPDLA